MCVTSVLAYRVIDYFILYTFHSTPEKEFSNSASTHPFIVRKFDVDKPSLPFTISMRKYKRLSNVQTSPMYYNNYVAFSLHCILNLAYHHKVHGLSMFLQAVIVEIPGD